MVASKKTDPWTELQEAEQRALTARRRLVLGEHCVHLDTELKLPRVGLALSGGGVRSATFALGLLRGLAGNRRGPPGGMPAQERTLDADGLLGRIDYLSTVSGGGYTGAMLGRLIQGCGLRRAQQLLADPSSHVLGWLRRNGRYLSTSGTRDHATSVVTYLRALLAIHAEFMVTCMLLGLVVTAPHLLYHSTQWLEPAGWEVWQTPWWVLAVFWWMATAPGLISGYWSGRDRGQPGAPTPPPRIGDVLFLLGCAVAAWLLWRWAWVRGELDWQKDALTVPALAALALCSIVLGQSAAQAWLFACRDPHALAVARMRNAMTRALRAGSLVAGILLGLGALDVVSWWLLVEFQSGNDRYLWGGVGLGGLLALLMRTLVQPLQQLATDATESGGHTRAWLPRLINVGSLLGLLALVLCWLVLLQWFVFAPDALALLLDTPAWMRAALVAGVWAAWVLLTAGNAQMPNTSSLHSFYRARLNRAYLAVGNPRRDLDGRGGRNADVTAVEEGDDLGLSHYRPEGHGGPIHLVNTCLNQTRDDLSGLYNADRKGTAVTASWRGLEVGPAEFLPMSPRHDAGTLGRWIAVSGAAASPGAGAYTSRGLALLMYFLGVRLGLWVRAPGKAVPLRWLSAFGWRFMPKPLMLASEAAAVYFGKDRPWWYLSDGGHFENTAVYPLLKRELDFIILSDASCDPRYEFNDLENLVRKARIDFGAEIDFYTREEACHLFSLGGTGLAVLSPEDLANNHTCRGVLLARIRYRERERASSSEGAARLCRPEGTLLVIKPNLHDALDLDVLAYAKKHEQFPHESTSDQSFDEAQWESYHRLGEDDGLSLDETWLAQLPGWRQPARHGLRIAARLREAKDLVPVAQAVPLWRRSTAQATAIGTTVGVSISGTLLLSLWQAVEQVQRGEAQARADVRQLFSDVSTGLQNLDARCPKVPEHVLTQTELLLDLRRSPRLSALERNGIDRLVDRIAVECQAAPDDAGAAALCPLAQQRASNDLCALALKPGTENTALNYWHPGHSPQEQAVAAAAVWRTLGQWTWWGPPEQTVQDGGVRPPMAGRPPPPPSRDAGAIGPDPGLAPLVPTLADCRRQHGRTTVYVQIYDEASRPPAQMLRLRLQERAGGALIVAPIENVSRSAEVSQQRRAVPWPQPTFVLHDEASRPCARAMAHLLGPPWVLRSDPEGQFWIRRLPRSLKARPGVVALWLPPWKQTAAPP